MAASDYVPTFFKKPLALGRHLNCLFAERYADQPPAICVEQRIYDSFPSSDDEARLAMFHKQDWNHRIDLLSSIEDERYRELGSSGSAACIIMDS